MVYKKFKDEEGEYIDVSSQRWTIMEAHEVFTPEGKNVGWDAFESLEEATSYYGLAYEPLNPEELLDNQEEID